MHLARAFALLVCCLASACGGGDSRLVVVDLTPPPLELAATPLLALPGVNECQAGAADGTPAVARADGTPCTSAGPNGRCYRGECMGIDAQCAAAWSRYTGHWVGGGRNGAPGSCSTNDECGELQCTNTEWSNYCTSYACPAGYSCSIGSTVLAGPATIALCSCLAAQGPGVFIRDGTPCGDPRKDQICLNRQCVARPIPNAAARAT